MPTNIVERIVGEVVCLDGEKTAKQCRKERTVQGGVRIREDLSVRALVVGATAFLIPHGLFSKEFVEKYRYLLVAQTAVRIMLLGLFLESLLEDQTNEQNTEKSQGKRVQFKGNSR